MIGLVKIDNGNVLNMEKQYYISVKNAMLLYTQNVLRGFTNGD